MDIDNIKKQVEIGQECLIKLSKYHPDRIKSGLEKIYDIYKDNLNHEYLSEEYNVSRSFSIEYNKDMIINSCQLRWSYWDSAYIDINSMGIKFVFNPEHGERKIIADLPWQIINMTIFDCVNE